MCTTYIQTIFLWNSGVWIITTTLEIGINSFQRKLPRKLIRVNCSRFISNEDMFDHTKAIPWSTGIFKERLLRFVHLMHLPSKKLICLALKAFIKPIKRPVGRDVQKTTWLNVVIKDMVSK